MSLIRVGSNEKYSDGWTSAFGKKSKKAKPAAKKTAKPAAKKKPGKAKKGKK